MNNKLATQAQIKAPEVTRKSTEMNRVQFKEAIELMANPPQVLNGCDQSKEPISYYKLVNEIPSGGMGQRVSDDNHSAPSLVRIRSYYLGKPERIRN